MLTVTKPTATTALFTVSTRVSVRSMPACVASYALVILRIFVGFFAAAILVNESKPGIIRALFEAAPANSVTHYGLHILVTVVDVLNSHSTKLWRSVVGVVVLYLVLRKIYTEESLLVIRGLGVQTSTSSSSYLWTSSSRFIPKTSIQDIFIHEAFKGFEIKYYMSIVLEGDEDVVVVFPNILPRRAILEEVWRGTRACLHEPKT